MRSLVLLSASLGALVGPSAALASGGVAAPRAAAAARAYSVSCLSGSPCVDVAGTRSAVTDTPSPWSGPANLGSAAPAPAATPSNFTWSGATPVGIGASNWSHGTNWVGGTGPTGTVGTLTFPFLTSSSCTAMPPADTCYQSLNDVSGVKATALSLDDGAPFSSPYQFYGNALTLGAGGLSASTASTNFGFVILGLPITLVASQTWSVDGNNHDSQIALTSNVLGTTARALTINLSNGTFLGIDRPSNVEVGPVTVNDTSPGYGWVSLNGGRLNASDGSTVTLLGTAGVFVPASSTIGALTASGTNDIQLGNSNSGAAILTVHGAATLGTASTLALNVIRPGTRAGGSYSQLSVLGALSIGGSLRLAGTVASGTSQVCPTLHVGDVETIVKTTGALSGTFTGVPNGTTVPVGCTNGIAPTVRINYTANSVTATVLTSGGPILVQSVVPNAGSTAGTNTVVITGANFDASATVNFGLTASPTVTFMSPTKLKAVAPAHASGVVDVTVTTSKGTSPTSSGDLYAYGPPTVTSFTPPSGITGSSVTINGTNFVPRAAVKFGTSVSTSVTFVSATQLSAIVPNGAAAGRITVLTPAGRGTSATSFTPTLSITGAVPASGPVGTLVTISGNGFNASSVVKFNGTTATIVPPVSATQIKATVPAGATTGPITVTNTTTPIGTVRSAFNYTVT